MTGIVLSKLTTEDLLELMQEDLYDGLADETAADVKEALARGLPPEDVLSKGLVAGMDLVGLDFRNNQVFVPEVLVAAQAMKAGMNELRPLFASSGAPEAGLSTVGVAVIGTVRGDIHDIGKNLVAMMLEGAGFEVINLGNNVAADKFVAAVAQYNAHILGLSALLTTTMPYVKDVVAALIDKGLRDKVTVLVGGAPLNEAFAREFGADAYCRDAREAVETAKKVMLTYGVQP